MEIRIRGFLTLRKAMGDQSPLVVDLEAPTIRGVFQELSNIFGEDFQNLMFDPNTREVRSHNLVLVNGRHCRNLPGGLDSRLNEGDEVSLFPPVVGG
jgi:MoaD family protein